MDNGWIKLHRAILQNEFLMKDDTAYILFTRLLLVCDRKSGQYRAGRYQLGALCGKNPMTIYKALQRLNREQLVNITSNNKYTDISICNWSKYQSDVNSQKSIGEHQMNTKQEVRNKKTTNVVEPSVSHGNPEINDIVTCFEELFGIEQPSSERKAAQWLRRKYGVPALKLMFRKVSDAQKADRYCPRTPTITKFHYAIPALQDYFQRRDGEGNSGGYSWD